MRKAFLITFFITILSAACLYAIPAYPGKIKVTQPDGSTRYILKHGDEWGHWLTDEQGRTVVKDADGYYRPVSGTQAKLMRRQVVSSWRNFVRQTDLQENGLWCDAAVNHPMEMPQRT